MAKQENIWWMTTLVKTSAAGEKSVFSLATSTFRGYRDSFLSVSVSSPLHLSNPPPKKKRRPENARCAHVTRLSHHHVFPARFTPSINTHYRPFCFKRLCRLYACPHQLYTPKASINWFINVNGMSTRLELFYAKRLGNCVHCTFIFTVWYSFFLRGFFFLYIVLSNTKDF